MTYNRGKKQNKKKGLFAVLCSEDYFTETLLKNTQQVRDLLKNTGVEMLTFMAENFAENSLKEVQNHYNVLAPLWERTKEINNKDTKELAKDWLMGHLHTQDKLSDGKSLEHAQIVMEYTVCKMIGGNVGKVADEVLTN